MNRKLKRFIAVLALLALASTACFSAHRISIEELARLQTGMEAESSVLALDGCGDGDPDAYRENVDGRDPATGCEVVEASPSSPIEVYSDDGRNHRVTPYNFTLSETQLVSPDYDLLLPAESLESAEVSVFSPGKTIGVIAGLTAAAVGTFLAISLTADTSRGLGGN